MYFSDLKISVLLVPLPRMLLFVHLVSFHLSDIESNVSYSKVLPLKYTLKRRAYSQSVYPIGMFFSLYVSFGFPGGSDGKESTCNAGDLGLIPGLGRFPGEGNGYPPQHSGLQNSKDYSPWGRKELDTTEQLSFSFNVSLSGIAIFFLASYLSLLLPSICLSFFH